MLKTKLWWLSDGEYAEKNPPLENVRTIKGEIWYQWIDDPKWLPVGYIPRPKSVFAWFVYHFIHGVWMKYPLWAIILFCLDRDNYPNCEAVEQTRAGGRTAGCAKNNGNAEAVRR